jgi:selenide,water dikinase
MQRELVLVGGGHSHVQVLRALAMNPLPGVRLSVIVDTPIAIYSGMVPGYLAGQYSVEQLSIDVPALARLAGAETIVARALSLDPEARRIGIEGGPAVAYDLTSINIGSTVAGLELPGIRQHALPTRPIGELVRRSDELISRAREWPLGEPFRVVVVGGGAGGVELAFTLEHRLRTAATCRIEMLLLHAGPHLLEGYPRSLGRRVERRASRRGIGIRCRARVAGAARESIRLGDGTALPCDALIWVTGAVSHPLFRDSGLATDPRGFVTTRSTLQVEGHDDIFAVGDCATLIDHPDTPKAGVYAVRQGPVLVDNLRAGLAGTPLQTYSPQQDFLTLLNLGDGTALGAKWGLSFEGRWVMRFKDWIDRRFMQRFSVD